MPRRTQHSTSIRTAGLNQIAKTLALPREFKPMRLPTFPNLERTAVLGFTDTHTLPAYMLQSSMDNAFPMLLTRDPAYPLWGPVKFAAAAWRLDNFAISSPPTGIALASRELYTVPITEAHTHFAGYFLEMDKVPIVHHAGNNYTLLGGNLTNEASFDADMYASVTVVTGSANPINLVAELQYLNEKLEPMTINIARAAMISQAGQFDYSIKLPRAAFAARWVSIQILNHETANNIGKIHYGFHTKQKDDGVTLRWETNTDWLREVARLMPLTAPPEFTTSYIWDNVRPTAVACLFSNVSAVMHKEGTISAARVCNREFPAFDVPMWNSFAAVAPHERYFGPAEKGLYAFTLPDQDSETFRDTRGLHWMADAGARGVLHAHLLAYSTCVLIKDPDVTTTTTIAITLDRHIEFRSTSRIFNTSYSPVPLEAFHTAQMALARLGTLHENPVHLATIASLVSRAVQTVLPMITPYAYQAVGAIANAGVNYVANKLGNMQQTAPGQDKSTKVKTPKRGKRAARRK